MVHGESHLIHGMACSIPYRIGMFCWNVIMNVTPHPDRVYST